MDDRVAWAHIGIPDKVFSGETADDWYMLSGHMGDEKEGAVNLVFTYTVSHWWHTRGFLWGDFRMAFVHASEGANAPSPSPDCLYHSSATCHGVKRWHACDVPSTARLVPSAPIDSIDCLLNGLFSCLWQLVSPWLWCSLECLHKPSLSRPIPPLAHCTPRKMSNKWRRCFPI